MPRKTDGMKFELLPRPTKGEDGKPLLYARPVKTASTSSWLPVEAGQPSSHLLPRTKHLMRPTVSAVESDLFCRRVRQFE